MKLNQWLSLYLPIVLSTSAFANADTSDRGFYIGADVGLYNNTKVEWDDESEQENSDFGEFGFNLVGGYEFNTHKVLKLGVEAEYRQFGKVTHEEVVEVEGQGYFVNVKPKFIVEYDQADVYLSLLAGLGSIKAEYKDEILKASKSKIGYQLGAEFGVILNRDIDLHIGYRLANMLDVDYRDLEKDVEIVDTDFKFGSAYMGVRYFF